jgi:iron-sulfur cluster repair protein YtfE (RIC family)
MKATDLLKKQHRDVKGLFKKMEKTEKASERRALMETITGELRMHTTIEEEIFYPAVREVESKKAEDAIDEALEEHHVVKLVLAELPRLDPADDRFKAKMTVLSELIEHHVEEEETEMFKLAEKLGKTVLADLGRQMAGRAEELKGMGRRAA